MPDLNADIQAKAEATQIENKKLMTEIEAKNAKILEYETKLKADKKLAIVAQCKEKLNVLTASRKFFPKHKAAGSFVMSIPLGAEKPAIVCGL